VLAEGRSRGASVDEHGLDAVARSTTIVPRKVLRALAKASPVCAGEERARVGREGMIRLKPGEHMENTREVFGRCDEYIAR
jgi:hypothetical protein